MTSQPCKCLKPISNFAETFVPSGLRHAWVHIGVLVGFAGNCCLKHLSGVTDWHIGCWVAYALDVIEVTVCVTGFTFSGFTEVARSSG